MSLDTSRSSDLQQVTQSRFLLAKYRIQVIEPDKSGVEKKVSGDLYELGNIHRHEGPEALDYNRVDAGAACSRDRCVQMLWCFWLPCAAAAQLLFACLNGCCDLSSEMATHLEEQHTLRACFCCECCRLKM